MKDIFIAVPSRYRLTETETNALNARIDRLLRKAEAFVSEECKLAMNYAYYFTEKTFQVGGYENECEITVELIEHAIKNLCNADFSVFPWGWEASRECRILHKVADECGVTPLVFKEEETA